MSEKRSNFAFPLRVIILMILVAALVPIAFVGWGRIYTGFIERTPPNIQITEFPRGVGVAPVRASFSLLDENSGLDEVVVRVWQKGSSTELLRKSLQGQAKAQINIEIAGEKSSLAEGSAEVEVRAFDRSLWSNASEIRVPVLVDYRRPKIEVLTEQHNARRGGSQLIFYHAYDEDLAVSGVKVGNRTYEGFPARGIDRDFEDPNLYAALYAIDLSYKPGTTIKLFAEDRVGNATSLPFYNKALDRSFGKAEIKASDNFLREQVSLLVKRNQGEIEEYSRRIGKSHDFNSHGSEEDLINRFKFVNESLREYDNDKIVGLLKGPRYERYFDRPFVRNLGSIEIPFGREVFFQVDEKTISSTVSKGFEVRPFNPQSAEVTAAASGIVIFSENIGTYGRTVALDHGFGLVSIYSHLEEVKVAKGDTVKAEQEIGGMGRTGLARNLGLYFEMRLHGQPVDPLEWCDKEWYNIHITQKINSIKKLLGLISVTPLE